MAATIARTTGFAATMVPTVVANSFTVLMAFMTPLANCATFTRARAVPSPTTHRLIVSPWSSTHWKALPAISPALASP